MLSVLASTGDPDRALNAVVRLVETLDARDSRDSDTCSTALLDKIDGDAAFCLATGARPASVFACGVAAAEAATAAM